ncbi:TonB-dependent vitamin B12 receptor [Luteimonas vadosa]|uniref:TonB-dependent vitamin B12 receptor n=1 Tax=Luteimonas vadosa TaxID=1165507 RepID=A0ABP9DYP1_9GAMM
MQRYSVSLAVALALATPFASAQDPTDLDEILVTATRTEIALEESLQPAQVIGREEIERSQARSLPELLRGRAGIDIGNQGGAGKLSTVFLRGSESDHVLVLVDGIRIGSATAGLVAFQDLPVEQIDRIEIVRGPRSSLYGSEAIGGVIQVFTRRDAGEIATRFKVGIGSHDRREASAGIGGGIGTRGWFGADVAYQATDGIDACRGRGPDPSIPFDFGAGCFVDQPDRDGYRNRSASLRGGIELSDALTLEASALRAESENAFDGGRFGGNEAENVQQALGTKLAWTPKRSILLTAQAGRSDDRSDNHYADAASGTRTYLSTFDTHRDTASVQADFGVGGDHLLSVGADWQRDSINSTTAFAAEARDNLAGFVEYQGRFGAQSVQASVRSDDNEQFGSHVTGGLGWGWTFADDLRLALSYGTGFKAPSFNDLYFPFFGNPDLRPERSKTLNAGLRGDHAGWRWTLDAYETRVDDLVTYDASIFLPNNLEQARIRGAEFTLAGSLAGWDLGLQLSHTDPRNRTPGANDGRLLARRARDTGRFDLDRRIGSWRLGGTLNAAGARYDNAANTVRLGGYATVDLRLAYALSASWTVQAGVTNLFDRAYETIAWYNQPGREYALSLRYAPAR